MNIAKMKVNVFHQIAHGTSGGPRQRWQARRLEWQHLFALVRLWRQRARQRYQLQQLSDHSLQDIGLSRSDAEQEASKAFWQP